MTIVVIDDDPTGSQTVHSCPLLLRWDVDTLRRGLCHPSPLLFVLANTRALPPEAAATRNREIVTALEQALQQEGLNPSDLVLVSRGDSTLRGHGVLEPQVLAQELADRFGPVQATLHVPAFLPGGRTTVDGEHRLQGQPVHTTPFARDGSFGFSTSQLDAWLEEKSAGAIPADSVLRLTGEQLSRAAAARRQDSAAAAEPFQALVAWLQALDGNQPVVVDAEHQEQLDALGAAVSALQGQRRFLFRSAASLINALVDGGGEPLGPQPLDAEGLAALRRCDPAGQPLPGLVVVGSHVPLADQQLGTLLADPRCEGLELPVARIARVLEGGTPDLLLADLEREWQERLRQLLADGLTPVLFTSRGELRFGQGAQADRRRLAFGMDLARLMARLAAACVPQLGYLISKGGITTGTLLAEGLGLDSVQLEGQLLPGLSLVRPLFSGELCAVSNARSDVAAPDDLLAADLAGLPILTFPGNLGDSSTLAQAWCLMDRGV